VINTIMRYLEEEMQQASDGKRRRWPQASSLIEKETFVARFRIRPLLGFAFRDKTGKM
jgi:hypothetical protein